MKSYPIFSVNLKAHSTGLLSAGAGTLRRLTLLTLLMFLMAASAWAIQLSGSAAAATFSGEVAPTVDRIEPPNWWTGHSINSVRLLIHGSKLTGVSVTAVGSGLRTSRTKVTGNGTYVFVDLKIAKIVRPGRYKLIVRNRMGSTDALFDIDKPLTNAKRFAGFSPDDVIYLILPDRFADGNTSNDDPAVSFGLYDRTNPHKYHGGDFQGIIDHLPYLKDLGVTTIWMTPIYDNYNGQYSGNNSADFHGYGSVNDYGVEEHFGTLQKLQELVNKAHALGIKVIQDQVANHVGQKHPWAFDPPTPTWFNGTLNHHSDNDYQIWTEMDPHANREESAQNLGGWFADTLPDLNQNDPEVARYEIQNTLWWLGETGIDGIREDTMPYVPRWFWAKWNSAIDAQYPKVNAVGEVFDGDSALVSFFQGGKSHDGVDTGMRSVFDYPGYFPLRSVFAHGDSFHDLVDDEAHDWLFPNPDYLVTFLGDHDVQRFMHEDGATVAGLKLAFTFLLTNRGIPVIYYGDEIGMDGGNDPDNRRDFPGGFPGDTNDAFTAAGRSSQQQDIWSAVSKLTHLRANLAPLRRGIQKNLYYSDKVWAYARTYKGQSVVVVLNNGNTAATISLPVHEVGINGSGSLVDQMGNVAAAQVIGGTTAACIPPKTGAILVFIPGNRH
jgi:glycosidase